MFGEAFKHPKPKIKKSCNFIRTNTDVPQLTKFNGGNLSTVIMTDFFLWGLTKLEIGGKSGINFFFG